VDGIVLLDKPRGLSSNHALQRVRRALRAEKAGHAGTLDPLATGMLPLCFGQATKACGSLLGQRKAYRATVRLGVATDTGDSEGRVTDERPVPAFGAEQVIAVLAGLRGERLQVPPMYSALKRDGQPLYEIARRGGHVEREARPIVIDALTLVAEDGATVEFEVTCSKGTYVRVLGEELAAGLGTVGHLTSLRRLWVEPFEAGREVSLAEIEAWAADGDPERLDDPARRPDWLLPVDCAFPGLPQVRLDDAQSLHLRQGRDLAAPAAAGGPLLRAYDAAGTFLGLVAVGPDGRLRVQRLFVPGAGTGPGPANT
jgi:tRNA pseudouridine55 synthase